MQRQRLTQVLVAVAVSGGLLLVVLSQLDTTKAIERLSSVEPRWVVLAMMFSVAVLLARGLRFRVLTTRAGLVMVTAAIGVHNFLVRITPFRLGELSLPYLLARQEPLTRTLVSLVLVRLLELWMWLVAGLLAVTVFFGSEGLERIWIAGLLLIVLTLLVVTFSIWLRLALWVGNAVADRARLWRYRAVRHTLHQLDEVVQEGATLSTFRRVSLGAATAAVVVLQYFVLGTLTYAFGLALTPMQIIVGVSLAQIFSALPVATVGTVGTYEMGWTIGFVWVGVGLSDAVITGIASQVITLAFTLLLAIPSSLVLGRVGQPAPSSKP